MANMFVSINYSLEKVFVRLPAFVNLSCCVIFELKSHSPLPPREGRHKVEKMDVSIFRPEITYGMLRIVI